MVELRFASGAPITVWDSFTLRDNYTDPLGSFSFSVSPPKAKRESYRNRLAKGELCSIYIDGAPQATCIITSREQKVDDDGYELSIEAKSLLATAYEGSVNPYVAESFQTDTPVKEVILKVLGDYGFDQVITDTAADVEAITGKSLVGRADAVLLDDLKHKDVQAGHGTQAYAFCARIFGRLGLALRVDNAGRLLVGAPDFGQATLYWLTQGITGGDQPHGAITVLESNDGQFSETLVFGKGADRRGATSGATPVAGVSVAGVERPADTAFSDTSTTTIPAALHTYRGPWKPRYVLDKRARDAERALGVAALVHGATATRAYTVRCTVDGLISRSARCNWAVDTVAHIQFPDLGIDEPMWLLETVKTGNREGGQQTALTFIPLHSLVLGA